MSHTLVSLFEDAATAGGDESAVYADGGWRSWAQWRSQAHALARGLQDLGIGKGDVVAVHLPNGWEFLIVHIAVGITGATVLPLHMGLGTHEVHTLVTRTRASVVVVTAEGHRALRKPPRGDFRPPKHVLVVGDDVDESAMVRSYHDVLQRWSGVDPIPVPVAPADSFLLAPSSGTTSSRPKICVHTHASLIGNAIAVATDAAAEGSDTIVSASLFTHLYGLLSVHLSLVTRGRQAVLADWDVAEFLRVAQESEATVLFAVPAQIRDILSRPDLPGATETGTAGLLLREIRASGAAVPAKLIADAHRVLNARVVVQWGMSELGAGLFTRPGDPPETAATSIGRPVSGGRARVVTEHGRSCGTGEIGELQFHSPYRCIEYFEDPELTAAAWTTDGWLRTGDRASVNADGTIAFRGRDVEVINVGGVKFAATEVETLLDELASLDRVAIVGRPDERLGEYPCALVTPRPGAAITLDEIVAHLTAHGLADYKIPIELIVLEQMPVTPTGKIARGRLVGLLDRGGAPKDSPWVRQLRALSHPQRRQRVLDLVCDTVRTLVQATAPIGPDQVFTDYGLTSSTAVRLRAELSEITGLDLPTTIAYDLPTANLIADRIGELTGDAVSPPQPTAPVRSRPEHDPVVVVGIGCRLPGGVSSPDQFWELLADGRETIGDFPTDRGWSADPDATYARRGSFLDAAAFDPEFFGIAPRAAVTMDPQQRLLLETTWEALEHARIDPTALRDSDTGVFVGIMASDYVPRSYAAVKALDAAAMTGNAAGVASGRISYVLGLRGPALTVDTACSSSLVALHLAVRSLRYGECTRAIVGGATVLSTPATFVEFAKQNGLAADGRCKPFSASADGTGWGEGVGVLVLERLSDARRSGRRILGIVRGTAINSDGTSNGLTAPNGLAQQRLIRQALDDAGLEPSDVDVLEAHGTGTTLGDPIEANALLATYGRDRRHPLLLGSVKSNIGHTQAAAGVLGTIKMLLALRHGCVPPTLHVDEPSPHVDWTTGTVRPVTTATAWPDHGKPRRAGVSAFGISGTNAHVILEQAPPDTELPTPRIGTAVLPLVLSAATEKALAAQAKQLVTVLDAGADPIDVGYSAATTRTRLMHRAVVFGADRSDLTALASGTSGYAVTGRADLPGRTVFVFPGHGAQWAGMAAALLESSPAFAASMSECETVLSEFADWSLLAAVEDESALRRTEVAQPVLFAVTVSLARLWQSYGVHPDAVVGHSFGEIAAAHVAGVLSLRDAVRAVVRRGALCAGLGGRMVSVESASEEVAQRISRRDGMSIAAHNSPDTTVVAGDDDAITALMEEYRDAGIAAHLVRIPFASHSAHVESVRDQLLAELADMRPQPARIPWYSTVTGAAMAGPDADAGYWYDNLRQPVRFAATIEAMAESGFGFFVESGPHPVLTPAITATIGAAGLALPTIQRRRGGIEQFANSLARGFVRGLSVDWAQSFAGSGAQQIDLPTYPFQHRRFWLDQITLPNYPHSFGTPQVQHSIIETSSTATLSAAIAPNALHTQLHQLDPVDQHRLVEDLILAHAAGLLGYHGPDAIAGDRTFLEIGFDSLTALELHDALNKLTGLQLPPVAAFDAETPTTLAQRVLDELREQPRVFN
ncbi:type I polyketide synthase [Nocardia vinacea]|uniref:type I polyketide synthase n=1 Tax=Nocardia vinacea TaxID=96468 RepID=UPI000308C869|nr:type I polyketide synthase [Nocardia vinacea]